MKENNIVYSDINKLTWCFQSVINIISFNSTVCVNQQHFNILPLSSALLSLLSLGQTDKVHDSKWISLFCLIKHTCEHLGTCVNMCDGSNREPQDTRRNLLAL